MMGGRLLCFYRAMGCSMARPGAPIIAQRAIAFSDSGVDIFHSGLGIDPLAVYPVPCQQLRGHLTPTKICALAAW